MKEQRQDWLLMTGDISRACVDASEKSSVRVSGAACEKLGYCGGN
jgi:hypothetical protein